MNFQYSEDQVMLRDGLRRFVDERYDFDSRRQRLVAAGSTDREMWSRFAEMGWLAVLVPEDAGGLGWTMIEGTIVAQELGRGLVAEPFLESAVLATRILALAEMPAGAGFLEGIASGETLIAPALFETRSRYNAAEGSTQLQAQGDGLALSGRKILIAGGDAADHFLVSATGENGLSLVMVPSNAPGVTRTSYPGLDGTWLSDVTFDGVAVPTDAVVASGNSAATVLAQALDEAALAGAAEAIGCMDRVLEITAAYLRTRQQFGQPLADFQVIQHRIADLFVEIEMARSALYSGLASLGADPGTRAAAVSAARVRIDQAARKVGNQGIHLHGGMGMTSEYPVGHYHRRLLVLARSFGDTEYHLARYESLRVAA